MDIFVYILLFLVLGIIAYQDLISRTIHWLTLPALVISILFFINFEIVIKDLLLNIIFLTGTMLTLVLYIRIRTGKFQDITKAHFGLGDILFLYALTPITSFDCFVVLFTIGTLFTLFLGLSIRFFSEKKTIPFAGDFALFLMLLISLDKFIPSLTFTKLMLR